MNKKTDTIAIALSKRKLLIYIICMSIFVIIGFLLIFNPSYFISPIASNINVIEGIGFLGILIFGFGIILLLKKILDKKKGLVISDTGIFDNSSSSAVGFIEWQDIIAITILDEETAKGVVIKVKDEEKYLSRVKNKIIKYNMRAVTKWYESPLIITATNLKIDNENLQKIIIQHFEKFKEK